MKSKIVTVMIIAVIVILAGCTSFNNTLNENNPILAIIKHPLLINQK